MTKLIEMLKDLMQITSDFNKQQNIDYQCVYRMFGHMCSRRECVEEALICPPSAHWPGTLRGGRGASGTPGTERRPSCRSSYSWN